MRYNREFLDRPDFPVYDPAALSWGYDDEPTHFTAYAQSATWLQAKATFQSRMADLFMLEAPFASDMKRAAFELWKYALMRMLEYYFSSDLASAVMDFVDLSDMEGSDKIIALIELLAKYPRVTETQIRAYLQDNI